MAVFDEEKAELLANTFERVFLNDNGHIPAYETISTTDIAQSYASLFVWTVK